MKTATTRFTLAYSRPAIAWNSGGKTLPDTTPEPVAPDFDGPIAERIDRDPQLRAAMRSLGG